MPKLLINLRGVPDDEADAIESMLDQHAIEHYRTPPGNWGISAGGIWISDESQADRAKELHSAFQRQRADAAKAEYYAARVNGEVPTLMSLFRQNPTRALAQWAGLVALLALSTLPFVWLALR